LGGRRRHSRSSDHATAIARGVPEAAARRVEEQGVARFELLGLAGPVLAEGRPLLADDPRERLAIRDQ